MEIRRIQLTGGSSLSVTLPKKWTDRFKLKGKDSVRFYVQKSGLLIIQPASQKDQLRRATLSIKDLTGDAIVREMIALSIAGTDEVLVKGSGITLTQRTRVRQVTQLLMGFEIISESSEEILIRNVLDPSKLPTLQNVEKMFVIAEAMFRDTITAVLRHDTALASDVIDRDFEVDKLHLALMRQFSISMQGIVPEEELGFSQLDLNYYSHIATQLERIADHAVRIANIVVHTKQHREKSESSRLPKITKGILPLLASSAQMVREVDKAFAHAMLDKNSHIAKFLDVASKNARSFQEKIVIDSLDRLRGYLMNIAEMTIDHAVTREQQQILLQF